MASARLLLAALACAAAATAAPAPAAKVLPPPIFVYPDYQTPTTHEPTTTPEPTTTAAPTTTDAPTTTAAPTTTDAPTTTRVPTTTAAPTVVLPAATDLGVVVRSRQSQRGITRGGASLSSGVSTTGEARNRASFAGLDLDLEKEASAETGASASSASYGDSGFTHVTETRADISSIGASRAATKTSSEGGGGTRGRAFTTTNTNADSKFRGILNASLRQNGLKVAEVEKKVAERSNVLQAAESKGLGAYKFSSTASNAVERFGKTGLPPPAEGLSAASVVTQRGATRKNSFLIGDAGALSQASTSIRTRTPGEEARLVSNSGTQAEGKVESSKSGDYQQDVVSETALEGSVEGVKARSATGGRGNTQGGGKTDQRAAAGGNVLYDGSVTKTLPSGEQVKEKRRAAARASRDHRAINDAPGNFTANFVSENDVKVKVEKPMLAPPQPSEMPYTEESSMEEN